MGCESASVSVSELKNLVSLLPDHQLKGYATALPLPMFAVARAYIVGLAPLPKHAYAAVDFWICYEVQMRRIGELCWNKLVELRRAKERDKQNAAT